jgi:hypothetical protein
MAEIVDDKMDHEQGSGGVRRQPRDESCGWY